MKQSNEYAKWIDAQVFADIPKTVFAAIAVSFAMRLSHSASSGQDEDDIDRAMSEIIAEWQVLHHGGIVPQPVPPYMSKYITEATEDES